MKLGRDSTSGILTQQMSKKPRIQCISGLVTMNDLSQAIMCYNGTAIMAHGIEEVYEITLGSDGLLISLATLDNNKILAMEKSLRAAKRKNIPILFDINGANLSVYRRDTALSFLNRYSIDVIKGTTDEVQAIVNGQRRHKVNTQEDENIKNEYRQFARKNKIVLVIIDDKNYITDGYSEFYINNGRDEFNKYTSIQSIISGMIAVAISAFSSKEERIQSVLTAVLAFRVAQELAYLRLENGIESIFIKSYLFDEISKIDADKLVEYGKVIYEFKR